MQEANGTELLDMLVRRTQAVPVGSTIGAADLTRPLAWRVVQPSHTVHVSPLPYHFLAVHVRGPATARSLFAGTRAIERVTHPGKVTTLPAGCDWTSELRSRVDFLHVLLPTQLVDRISDESKADGLVPIGFHERLATTDPTIERLGLRLLAAMRTEVGRGTVAVDEIADELVAHLLCPGQNQQSRAPKSGLSPHQMRRTVEYMRENLTGDISLADIAATVALSPFHFARCFRQTAGEPPHRYLTRMRVDYAKELLNESTLDIIGVALLAGFKDQSRMTKVFQATLGFPPGEYRKIVARPSMPRPSL